MKDQDYAVKQRRRDEEREMMQRDGDERTKLFESVFSVTAVTAVTDTDECQGYEEVEATYMHSDIIAMSDEPFDFSEFDCSQKVANSDDDPYAHLN